VIKHDVTPRWLLSQKEKRLRIFLTKHWQPGYPFKCGGQIRGWQALQGETCVFRAGGTAVNDGGPRGTARMMSHDVSLCYMTGSEVHDFNFG